MITGIRIYEAGDYSVTGDAEVKAEGGLFLTNLDVFESVNDALVSDPVSPITSGGGNWTAVAEISGLDWTNLTLSLNNDLTASASSADAGAWIQKKVSGTSVMIEVIPEPATLALLGLGAFFARKRK